MNLTLEIGVGVSLLATIVAEDMSDDDLDLLVVATRMFADALAVIAVERDRTQRQAEAVIDT